MLKIIDRWFYMPIGPKPLAQFRVLLGLTSLIYLLIRGYHILRLIAAPSSRFSPIGILSVFENPPAAIFVILSYIICVLTGIAFVLGYKYKILAPIHAILSIVLYSYRSSWGMIFHTENLMVLHLLIISVCPAADVLSMDAKSKDLQQEINGRYGWGIRLLCISTISSYFLAGVAKVKNAGWDWASGDILRVHIAYDNLRKIEMGDWYAPLGVLLISYAWIFPILGVMTLILELGAPIALFSKRLGQAWAIGIWSFHLGVVLMMAIVFFYPLTGLAFWSFFVVNAKTPMEKA